MIISVLAGGAVVVAQAASDATLDWLAFGVCSIVCLGGSFYEVRSPSGHWLHPHLLAFVFAALTLPPAATAAIAVVAFVPVGVVRGRDPYRIAFNAAGLAMAGTAAGVLAVALGKDAGGTQETVALFAASLALVVVNHALHGAVTSLAAGERARHALLAAAGLAATFGVALALDLALALTGASLVALWMTAPEALPLAIGPVALACAALWVPMLRHASRTDSKTGLFNYSHFRHLLSAAIASAHRSGRPVSVLMVDLDHLRTVNNRHGHLAGDALIAAVARILADCVEGSGSAGRFGGEEFCAALPGIDADAAQILAEEVRAQVADRRHDGQPPASVSIGVASFPEHGTDVEGLLHAADMALYDAKLSGRDRVRAAPRHDTPAAAPQAAHHEPQPEPVASTPVRGSWVGPYTALLLTATAFAALLADRTAIGEEPLLFGALLASVVGLDAIRLDLFERLRTSPAALPVLALAAIFGPLGPIAGEALILGVRLLRRAPTLRASFDFAALSVSGVAGAVAFRWLEGAGADFALAGLGAGVAYYAVNIPLLALVIWLANGTNPLVTFRTQLAWLLPHYAAFGALAGVFLAVWDRSGWTVFAVFGVPTALLWIGEQQYLRRSRSGFENLQRSHAELERANADLRRLLTDNQALLQRLQSSYLSTITSLARTIEAKDPYTGGHTERVARVAAALAAELGFAAEDLQAVEVGAAIHDIGKIGVPDATLLKPGPLTPHERSEIERHPEISSYIVSELDVPAIVKQMVRSHHERFDGAGYPDRLAAEEIPLSARILSVADALDAMTTDRPYRPAMSTAEALKVIDECSGSQFCPEVVGALRRCLHSEDPRTDLRTMEVVA